MAILKNKKTAPSPIQPPMVPLQPSAALLRLLPSRPVMPPPPPPPPESKKRTQREEERAEERARRRSAKELAERWRQAELVMQQRAKAAKAYKLAVAEMHVTPAIRQYALEGIGHLRVTQAIDEDVDGAIYLYMDGVPYMTVGCGEDEQCVETQPPLLFADDEDEASYREAFSFDPERLAGCRPAFSLLVQRQRARDSLRVLEWDPAKLTLVVKMEEEVEDGETSHIYTRLRFAKLEAPVLTADEAREKTLGDGVATQMVVLRESARTRIYNVPRVGLLQLDNLGTPSRCAHLFLTSRPKVPHAVLLYREASGTRYRRNDAAWLKHLRSGDIDQSVVWFTTSRLLMGPQPYETLRAVEWDASRMRLHLDGECELNPFPLLEKYVDPAFTVDHTRMELTFAPLPMRVVSRIVEEDDAGFEFTPSSSSKNNNNNRAS